MKPEILYRELINLAERLGIQVAEQNFRTAGIRVQSGFCKVQNQDLFLIDKHLKLSKKIEVLVDFLGELPIDEIFVVPAVRDYLERIKPQIKSRRAVHDRTDERLK